MSFLAAAIAQQLPAVPDNKSFRDVGTMLPKDNGGKAASTMKAASSWHCGARSQLVWSVTPQLPHVGYPAHMQICHRTHPHKHGQWHACRNHMRVY